jgi:hypothetical protein
MLEAHAELFKIVMFFLFHVFRPFYPVYHPGLPSRCAPLAREVVFALLLSALLHAEFQQTCITGGILTESCDVLRPVALCAQLRGSVFRVESKLSKNVFKLLQTARFPPCFLCVIHRADFISATAALTWRAHFVAQLDSIFRVKSIRAFT